MAIGLRTMSLAVSENASAAHFPTTHWSRVAAAGDRATPEDREVLAELCRAYWYPLYAFIRRRGHDPDDAQDLTQAYFARLLERGVLAAADRRKGRFRAFLRTDCGYFLADQRDRERALKRGGGIAAGVDRRPRRRGPLSGRAGRREPRPSASSTAPGP